MSTRSAGFALSAVVLLACSGLDPNAFKKKRPAASAPESAGWYFDAGDRDGASGGSPASRGGAGQGLAPTGGAGARDTGSAVDGGEGGAATDPDGASGSVPTGGAGARTSSGGTSGAPSAGQPAAGTGGRGGTAAAGGRAGASGQGGHGGAGSASGGAAANGGTGVAGASGGHSTPDVYFSEYVEGSSSYKALEIRARTDAVLTGCRLVTYFNGGTTGSGIALDASITASAPYVLCSSQLAALLGAVCTRTTNLTFNGDDAIAIECGGVNIDVLGQIGVDPGDGWGSGDASTLNHTLKRRCPAVADPDGSNAFEPSDAWDSLPVDTFDGLGRADCAD